MKIINLNREIKKVNGFWEISMLAIDDNNEPVIMFEQFTSEDNAIVALGRKAQELKLL